MPAPELLQIRTCRNPSKTNVSPASLYLQMSVIKREKALDVGLRTLRKAGVEGVMVDVWWGIVEEAGPRKYDFSAYKRLFRKVAEHGLKIQAVMSFHAAGGNVGDTCKIPLPPWVLHIGEGNPDIFYTDSSRHRNKEYISLGCDHLPLFWGRSPMQMYCGFIEAFADEFNDMLGAPPRCEFCLQQLCLSLPSCNGLPSYHGQSASLRGHQESVRFGRRLPDGHAIILV